MNKAQAEKKEYTFHAVFNIDVNDVKPFQNPTGRLPADHFLIRAFSDDKSLFIISDFAVLLIEK